MLYLGVWYSYPPRLIHSPPWPGLIGWGDSKHACIIAVFLLVRLLYLLIHSLNYLFRPIQTLAVLADLIDLIVMFSLIACCLLNLFLKLTFSHWCSHSKSTHLKRSHLFIIKQQQYWLCRIECKTIEFSIIKFESQLRFWVDLNILKIIKQKISFCNCRLLKLA